MDRMINRQVQGIDLGAAIGVLVAISVVAAFSVSRAVPCVALASSFGEG